LPRSVSVSSLISARAFWSIDSPLRASCGTGRGPRNRASIFRWRDHSAIRPSARLTSSRRTSRGFCSI
jgi:hypothetical protein